MLLFFEELIAIRRPIRSHSSPEIGQNINTDISASEVQLIDHEGNNLGIVPTQQALQRANDASLDLVEIAPNASPPVCKILDYGRFKYHAQKKAAEARKRQKIVEVKEVKMRPNIDTHDYDVKIRNMRRFFSDGDKVKVTLRFRGREMAHQNLGMDLLERVRTDLSEITKVESSPRLEGRQMIMILAPLI